jgi:phage-related protein
VATKSICSKLVYDGEIFRIEFYVAANGLAPAEKWLDDLNEKQQQKFAALFVRLGDHGKIWNEQKFKHLTGTDQVFEFKVDDGRILSFFFFGKRLILTHGFVKRSAKTPKAEIERAEVYKRDFEQREKTPNGK